MGGEEAEAETLSRSSDKQGRISWARAKGTGRPRRGGLGHVQRLKEEPAEEER